jgi:hypothetical protein
MYIDNNKQIGSVSFYTYSAQYSKFHKTFAFRLIAKACRAFIVYAIHTKTWKRIKCMDFALQLKTYAII